MTYLLDVNALIAIGLSEHLFHDRVVKWVEDDGYPQLATCSITELGFIRVISQTTKYDLSLAEAKSHMVRMKRSTLMSLKFLSDSNDIHMLPNWVKSGAQTTDGHLVALAQSHGAKLATLDTRIPGAFLIP